MKIKTIPEDFIVEEIVDGFGDGDNNIYIMEKKGIENLRALSYIAKKFGIRLREIGYCGLKDKHALTKQYISIPRKYGILDIEERNLKLKYVGTGKKLKIGDLRANKFTVVVRNVKSHEIEKIKSNVEAIKYGVPNYFGDQRFGSVFNGKFIAKEVTMHNFEEAIKIYLTNYNRGDRLRKLKRYIRDNWNDWQSCLKYMEKNGIKNKEMKNILNELYRSKNFERAFEYIDNRVKQIFISAYQSYLWNECVKDILTKKIDRDDMLYINYRCGKLLFYKKIDGDNLQKFPAIVPYRNYEEDVKEIVGRVLQRENISMENLTRNEKFGKFNYYERKIILKPILFEMGRFERDEFNTGKYKIKLEFILEKGSYATILLKRLLYVG